MSGLGPRTPVPFSCRRISRKGNDPLETLRVSEVCVLGPCEANPGSGRHPAPQMFWPYSDYTVSFNTPVCRIPEVGVPKVHSEG